MTDEEQLQRRGITIDILAQELQIKQKRLNKYRDKIYEQQEVLKNKNEYIEFYKREASDLRKELHKVDKNFKNNVLQIEHLEDRVRMYEDELESLTGEKPLKTTNRLLNLKKKKGNGKNHLLESDK